MMNQCRILTALMATGLAGCQSSAPPAPLRSPLNVRVLSARPTGLSVEATRPLAWAVIEVDPTGRLRLLYADSAGSDPAPGALQAMLPIDRTATRNGRRIAAGPAPRWVQPCVAEGNEVATDPQSGLRLYVGSECLQRGTGRVESPPAAERTGYWLVLGAVRPPTGPALRRMLERAQPLANPAGLAPVLANALFGQSDVLYDYTVLPIPDNQPAP